MSAKCSPRWSGGRRAERALQQVFVDAIALAAARHPLAPGQSPEVAGRALTFLVNGSVESWLRAPGRLGWKLSSCRWSSRS